MSLPNPDDAQESTLDRLSTEIEIAADRNVLADAINLYVMGRQRFGRQRRSVMTAPTFTTYESDADSLLALREPTLKLSYESARRLMDELWRCGIRPTDQGTTGQIEAMAAHLQDMRKLVFDFIDKIGKPPIEISGGRTTTDQLFNHLLRDEELKHAKADADNALLDREFGRRKE